MRKQATHVEHWVLMTSYFEINLHQLLNSMHGTEYMQESPNWVAYKVMSISMGYIKQYICIN